MNKEQLIKELEEIGIIEAIGDGISIQDTSYQILFQNKVSKSFVGDHTGEYCYMAYEHRDNVCKGCALTVAFKDGKTHTAERSIPIDNVIEYFEITASPLKDSTGNIIAGIEIARNITRRKQAEEKLEESENRYRMLFESAGDAIFIFEAEGENTGKIVSANQSAAEMHEYTVDELLELKITDLDTPDAAEDAPDRIRRILDGEWIKAGITHRKKDGTVFPVEISAGLLEVRGHKYILAFDRDITKRKQAEKMLQSAHDNLEERVEKRTKMLQETKQNLKAHTAKLEETNTAFKFLLKQLETKEREFEENILSNIKHLIFPYIEKLKKSKKTSKELSYVNIIESNLKEIIAPFSQKLSSKYLGLTPKEIQIADLIRDGKHDKDMVEMLNISLDTVKTHRKNIRKKVGIYSKRTNLRTWLLTSIK